MGKAKPTPTHPQASSPGRFARPITNTAESASAETTKAKGLQLIPPLKGDGVMMLADVIGQTGANEIIKTGALRFHSLGDSGGRGSRGSQEEIAEHMNGDFSSTGGDGGLNPAFCLHLGDVVYGPGKESEYLDQFYRAYTAYPGKFVAIPGNHDGELTKQDPHSLAAFLDNFCRGTIATPPTAADVGIEREVVAQPGVYWQLDTPYAEIIGLYTNVNETQGYLTGLNGDSAQVDWLATRLADIATKQKTKRKALIFAVHHPIYSEASHTTSPHMLTQLDDLCEKAGIMPDMVLCGHAHNYQRHTRYKSFNGRSMQIPYIVAGCGGYPLQRVAAADGQMIGDRTFDKSLKGYGYLLIEVTTSAITVEMWQPTTDTEPFDTVVVNLATNQVTSH
jgi:hypothetical protein